ncbi:hypothetical protein HHK36_023223 [Tetracentron sinense]|uniref:Argonaute 2 n=1 Tax=Tetracentron sinense TaxID=13715 RepID=A0A834YQV5_TETSI|nr:hypothetical protein HHK36_023223 [Tetracentron sinense]
MENQRGSSRGRGSGRGRSNRNPGGNSDPNQQRSFPPVPGLGRSSGQAQYSGNNESARPTVPNSAAIFWRGLGQGRSSGKAPYSGDNESARPTIPNSAGVSAIGSSTAGAWRGSGRGRGRTSAPVQSQSSESVSDHSTFGIQSLEISQQLPPSTLPQVEERIPVKRPDKGGKNAESIKLLVNHFLVTFKPNSTIHHYDIDIKPEVPPNQVGTVLISKSDLCAIKNELHQKFPMSKTAYDKEKNIFSAVVLPPEELKMDLRKGKDLKTYIITAKFVKELDLQRLQDYLNGILPLIPREILQGMDVVMKENPSRNRLPIGRGFYPTRENEVHDIGYGLIASPGFQHSLKPTSQGLALCVDYSVLPFRKSVPVLEFLRQHINFKVDKWNNSERANVEVALKGLSVMVNHRKTRQKYTIMGLTNLMSRDLRFTIENPEGKNSPREVRLVDYFRDTYQKEIENKNLPCLDLSKNKRINYVPMEFCVLVEGQRYPKELMDWNTARNFTGIAMVKPSKRKELICQMVQDIAGPCGGDIAQNFGISVHKEMTDVTGHMIRPPYLKLGDSNGKPIKLTLMKDKCEWNLVGRSVLNGKQIDRWAIINFSSSDIKTLDQFVADLKRRCCGLKIPMKDPLTRKLSRMNVLSDTDQLRGLLKEVCAKKQLQILICVMSKKDSGYKFLKWICETEIGILTQCCLSNHLVKCNNQYLTNLALKINAKLGGSNFELFDRLPHFGGNGHVMFMGADVNHPTSCDTKIPSIAAVVATMNWPAANQYAARIRPQDHRKERIQNFGEMCLELLNRYTQLNKVKPQKIVVFRDGVSDSQFNMVLNDELTDLERAIVSERYSPTITLIVAQKRHQTRLFRKNKAPGPSTENVSPGTVVDTTIVHPSEFDFYLCSHYGSLGTSKPTHYHVLCDNDRFTSDHLQKVIYYLCFTFARCTKPVSLVPPVYYADLVAYRGRQYQESLSSTSEPESTSLFDRKHYKLHSNIENVMFFC